MLVELKEIYNGVEVIIGSTNYADRVKFNELGMWWDSNCWKKNMSMIEYMDFYIRLIAKFGKHNIRFSEEARWIEDFIAKVGMTDRTDMKLELPFEVYNHQAEAVKWSLNKEISLILHEMGLGKTYTAMALYLLWKTKEMLPREKLLYICPSMLILNVAKEFAKFGMTVQFYPKNKYSQKALKTHQIIKSNNPDVYIVSYTSLGKIFNKWDIISNIGAVVFDEVHFTKNPKTIRSTLFSKIARAWQTTPIRQIYMTGTPIMNQPVDMWTYLSIVDKRIGSYQQFAERYNGSKLVTIGHNTFYKLGKPQNLDELHGILQQVAHRRTKEQCLDLPPKIRDVLFIDVVNVPFEKKQREIEVVTHVLKHSAIGKAKNTLALAESLGTRTIIFTEYNLTIDVMLTHAKSKRIGVINGKVTVPQRMDLVEKYQNGELDILIINRKAGGTGLNITETDTIIFNDLHWSAGEVTQAEDRVHRIGLKKSVNIYYMVSNEALDHYVATTMSQRYSVMEAVVDGKTDSVLTRQTFMKDLNNYVSRHYKDWLM